MVRFDHFSIYRSGAFFLAPDERSHSLLSSIMRAFNRNLPLLAGHTSDPHMSIARGLESADLRRTRLLFSKMQPSLSFRADGISLRRLNMSRGQYDVVDHFPFSGIGMGATQFKDCIWQAQLF